MYSVVVMQAATNYRHLTARGISCLLCLLLLGACTQIFNVPNKDDLPIAYLKESIVEKNNTLVMIAKEEIVQGDYILKGQNRQEKIRVKNVDCQTFGDVVCTLTVERQNDFAFLRGSAFYLQ
jgi:hypothetical protein